MFKHGCAARLKHARATPAIPNNQHALRHVILLEGITVKNLTSTINVLTKPLRLRAWMIAAPILLVSCAGAPRYAPSSNTTTTLRSVVVKGPLAQTGTGDSMAMRLYDTKTCNPRGDLKPVFASRPLEGQLSDQPVSFEKYSKYQKTESNVDANTPLKLITTFGHFGQGGLFGTVTLCAVESEIYLEQNYVYDAIGKLDGTERCHVNLYKIASKDLGGKRTLVASFESAEPKKEDYCREE